MADLPEFDIVIVYPEAVRQLHESMLPLGIMSIVSALEENNYRVLFVDFYKYRGNFKKDLKIWNPRIVGIGGTTLTRKISFSLARQAKSVLQNCKIVYGGPHASFTAVDTLQHVAEIDYIIRGEGEYSFLDLCNHYIRKSNPDYTTIAGLCYRSGSEIVLNPPKRIDNLDLLPIPKRDFSYKLRMDFIGVEGEMIITSRGCPVCCTFCSASTMFPGGVRFRSISHIKQELDYILANKKIQGLKIFDSTFTSSPQHVLSFCEMIKPYNLKWECEIRADSVDKEMLSVMKEAGCYYVDVGLETSNEYLLKKIGKKINIGQLNKVLEWCSELGIKTKVFMIFGLLDETYKECFNDIRFLLDNKDKISMSETTFGMQVFPGTILERQLKMRGVLPKDFSWAKYSPPKKNYLLMEVSDVYLLEQKQLSIYKLLWIGMILLFNNSVLTPSALLKVLRVQIRAFFRIIKKKIMSVFPS